MAKKLNTLNPYDDDDKLQVIVETPRGAALKFDYDSKLRVFKVSRALPLGVSFPYDFGFVPGTKAPDGDPVDALVLNQLTTYPGVLMTGRLLGMVELTEKSSSGQRKKREVNNRLVVAPEWGEGELAQPRVPEHMRAEIEQFFLSTAFFTGKEVKVSGWSSARKAGDYVAKYTL